MHVILIAPMSFDNSDGAHRPAQLARELARRGHTVTYVEIEKSRAAAADVRVVNFETLGWDEVELLKAWYGFDYASPAQIAWGDNTSGRAELKVVINSAPFRPALELTAALAAQGYAPVYDVLDDISELRALGAYCYDELSEEWLAQAASLIITLSPRLHERFAAYPNVTLIRDGVDLAPFKPPPIAIPPPRDANALTLGFWGTMWDYNLDVPLLQTLTRARPHWQWAFIGAHDLDPARPSIAQALAAPNVYFHAPVPRAELAQRAREFDVCILPTPVTPFNLARDPLKVYEYLACHKPVVATALTQLADMPYVTLTHSADEFLAAVERAAHTPVDTVLLDAWLAQQTWARRVDALEAALVKLPPAPTPLASPPRGAMPHATEELPRWRAYAAHLERVVRERERHLREVETALAQSSVGAKARALGLGGA